MILSVKKIGLSLEIDDKLLNSLAEKGMSYCPNEFGGFLVGYYNNDNKHLCITDSLLPKKFYASRCSFERSTKGIERKLKKYFKQIPKKYYVGEWHTHPDSSTIPSDTDILAITAIINNKNSGIANPVLLIIGYSKTQINFGFYVCFKNKLYRYE